MRSRYLLSGWPSLHDNAFHPLSALPRLNSGSFTYCYGDCPCDPYLLLQVMDKLTELMTRPTPVDVVIVGGGYAGVELAATVAEKLADQGRVKVT